MGDRGQASVEVALVLPVLVVVALVIVQVGWLVHDRVLVVHVAREAARAAAVSDVDLDPAPTGLQGGLDPSRLEVQIEGPDGEGMVTAVAIYDAPTQVAIVGALVPDLEMRSQVTMIHEGSLG
jgi:hypothetical protein